MTSEKTPNIFILGAGLGTRLRPITNNTPKPLIKILNKEMINYNFELFYKENYNNFIVNIAYLKEKFMNFIPDLDVNIKFSVEDEPLGTGGGVKFAKKLFKKDEDTIIMNGDIIYDFKISDLTNFYYKQQSPLATMVLKPSEDGNVSSRDGIITSIRGIKSKNFKDTDKKYQFTGLHIISPKFLDSIDDFCIIDTYIKYLDTNKIFAFIEDQNLYWSDIGKIDSYYDTTNYLVENHKNLKVLTLKLG